MHIGNSMDVKNGAGEIIRGEPTFISYIYLHARTALRETVKPAVLWKVGVILIKTHTKL